MSYNSINFEEIKTVEFVLPTDPDVIKFRNNIFNTNKSNGKSKRLDIIKSNPDLFNKIITLWNSEEYERYLSESNINKCANCKKCSIDKFHIGKYVCWLNWPEKSRPTRTYLHNICNEFDKKYIPDKVKFYETKVFNIYPNIEKIGVVPGNFKYFLLDIGLLNDNPIIMSGWKEGKNKETEFIKYLHRDDFDYVCFLPDIFKIKYKDDSYHFRFLDARFSLWNKFECLIEYKSRDYYFSLEQINDYIKLYHLATHSNNFYACVVVNEAYDNDFENTNAYKVPYINKYTEESFLQLLQGNGDFI